LTTSAVQHRPRRLWLIVGASVLIVLVAGAGLALFRYLPLLDDARDVRASMESLYSRVTRVGLAMDRQTLAGIERDMQAVSLRIDRLAESLASDPVMAIAAVLPPTRDAANGARALTAAAQDTMAAGKVALRMGSQYVAMRERSVGTKTQSTLESLAEVMVNTRDDATQLRSALAAARDRLRNLPDGLPGPLGEARAVMGAKLDEVMPFAEAYVRAADALPDALGWNGPKRYLVLAQDPAELRPTGGFVGTYGIVAFDKGRLTERVFRDVYTLDLKPDPPYVPAPAPLQGHLLGNEPWLLADANWSPDFTVSARQALQAYTLESGDDRVDGVIGLTTYAIDRLLEVTGPVDVPEYGVSVSAGQTTMVSLEHTRKASEPGQDRKAFLDALATHLLDRLMALPLDRWTTAVEAAEKIRVERLASVWFADPEVQALAAEARWDGSVRRDAGDYLYTVDANLAPASKYNLVTGRTQSLEVQIDRFGNAHNALTVAWTNRLNELPDAQRRFLRSISTSDVYGTFVRILAPARSRLVSVSGGTIAPVQGAEQVTQEAGRASFGNYLMVPPGQAALTYAWISPYAADTNGNGEGRYVLTVQKQPGTLGDEVDLSITVPPGSQILEVSPGMSVDGATARLSTRLTTDLVVAVRFGPGG
jgi:hypothetical protein